MNISTVAPFLIAYLLGFATPIAMAVKMDTGGDRPEGCFLLVVLAAIGIAIMVVFYYWVSAPAI